MARREPVILTNNILFDSAVLVTPSTVAGSFTAAAVIDWRPYTRFKATAEPATLTFDLGTSKLADTVALAGHDFGIQGTTWELRRSTDNFAASDVLVVTASPSDNKIQYKEYSSVSSRYWRIKMLSSSSLPFLGVVYIGERFAFTRFMSSPFAPNPNQMIKTVARSQRGHVIGSSVKYVRERIRLTFKTYPYPDFVTFKSTIWDPGIRKDPFILVWDPGDHPDDGTLVEMGDGFNLDPVITAATVRLSLSMMGTRLDL